MSKRNLLITLCLALAATLAIYYASRSQPAPVSYELISAAEAASHARYERALEKRVTLQFQELPLDQAVKQIADRIGLPIRIDEKALTDASLPITVPVTFDVSGITLRSALNRLLNPMDLTWILKDEALLVTTPEKAGNELIVVVHPVFDLVGGPSKSGTGMVNYQQLIDVITAEVSPTTWDEGTGPSPIHEDRAAGALVFAQTREVHAEVRLLLTALRHARDAQGIRPGKTITSSSSWPFTQPAMGGGTFVPPAPVVPQPARQIRPKATGNATLPMTPIPNTPAPSHTPQ